MPRGITHLVALDALADPAHIGPGYSSHLEQRPDLIVAEAAPTPHAPPVTHKRTDAHARKHEAQTPASGRAATASRPPSAAPAPCRPLRTHLRRPSVLTNSTRYFISSTTGVYFF